VADEIFGQYLHKKLSILLLQGVPKALLALEDDLLYIIGEFIACHQAFLIELC
jgi:hypothetical protein